MKLPFEKGDIVHIPGSWLYNQYGVGEVVEALAHNIQVKFGGEHVGAYSLKTSVVYLDKMLCFYNAE